MIPEDSRPVTLRCQEEQSLRLFLYILMSVGFRPTKLNWPEELDQWFAGNDSADLRPADFSPWRDSAGGAALSQGC